MGAGGEGVVWMTGAVAWPWHDVVISKHRWINAGNISDNVIFVSAKIPSWLHRVTERPDRLGVRPPLGTPHTGVARACLPSHRQALSRSTRRNEARAEGTNKNFWTLKTKDPTERVFRSCANFMQNNAPGPQRKRRAIYLVVSP